MSGIDAHAATSLRRRVASLRISPPNVLLLVVAAGSLSFLALLGRIGAKAGGRAT